MKFILTICIVLIFFISNAQKATFSGQINGINNTEIEVWILPLIQGETPIFDQIKCVNGKFECSINFNLNMWHLVRLNSEDFNTIFGNDKFSEYELKNREIIFFIYPGDHLSIQSKIGDFGIDYQISGNEFNKQRNLFAKNLFPLEEEFNRLVILNETENQIRLINKKLDSTLLNMIANHPDWIYSAETLAAFPEDIIAKYFETFTPEVQNSFFGKHLSKILNAPKIGTLAPDFTLNDKTGKDVSLSDFTGKYVVLDFWGTWCGYCIRGIPKMKEYYSKYQDKIEFVSIGCNDTKQVWLRAIDKYQLNWINLFTENQEIADKYGVEGYPTKIIIDKEGKIAYRVTGEVVDFYDSLDGLFK